ncbi:hypothetical protein [Dyella koreensis]|uniref:Uncharacterized protein n=1 Tax=Dyella koreensis TaxID=311235 RepID=A0ABW8K6U0_9GAMM
MPNAEEEAVIVRSVIQEMSEDILSKIHVLEDELTEAISHARSGEYDGNEIGQGELVLFMYGPNAESLLASVEAKLRESELTRLSLITIRYGGPGAPTRIVRLSDVKLM